MKRILSIITLFAALVAGAVTLDEVPNVHVADARRYVSNPSGVLSDEAVARLDRLIAEVWRRTGAELVVVAVDEVDPSMTPHDFAYRLLQRWGVGKRDVNNGVVMLISRDDRRVEIVTGRGVEGVLPDIVAGRIAADEMAPHFSRGDYDGGATAGVEAVARVLTDPQYADELRSRYANDQEWTDDDSEELWQGWLAGSGLMTAVMVVIAIAAWRRTRRMPLADRYAKLQSIKLMLLIFSFLTLGMTLPVFLIFRWRMKRLRTRRRNCPNCGARMVRLPEDKDNEYLTPSQDLEERLNSVDYDVWLCPACHETDIVPFVNRDSSYRECPRCHARAMSLTSDRRILAPMAGRDGMGERVYTCRNCGNTDRRRYVIPHVDMAGPAIAAGLGAMAAGRGGGGGFSGGSFGGGSSAGGGAGASW